MDGRVHSDLCAGDALQEAARAEGDMRIQPSVINLLICSLIYSAACFALPLIHPLTSFLALLLTIQVQCASDRSPSGGESGVLMIFLVLFTAVV